MHSAFEDHSSLAEICWQKSLADLSTFLDICVRRSVDPWDQRDLIHLVFWPEGLEHIITRCGLPPTPATKLMGMAFEFRIPRTARYLMRFGIPVTFHHLELACLQDYDRDIYEYIVNHLRNNKVQSNLILVEKPKMFLSWKPEGNYPDLFTPYHARWLETTALECLWEAGFDNVDIPLANAHGETQTPLWGQIRLPERYGFELRAKSLEWLCERGARMSWVHPQSGTTPAHWLARSLSKSSRLRTIKEGGDYLCQSELFRDLVFSQGCDSCICHCSMSGCIPIACVFSKYWTKQNYQSQEATEWQKTIHMKALEIVDEDEAARQWMGAAILRVLTFDEVGLVHTCCYRMHYDWHGKSTYTRLSRYEINEIREVESKDIALFESLVEEFKRSWKSYLGAFHQFLDEVWESRMKEVFKRSSQEEEEEIKRIEELGVVLDVVSDDEQLLAGDDAD